MISSLALLSFLTAAAFAQSSSSSAAASTSTGNPLVPGGISPSCSTYLSQLDSANNLSPCSSAIISATSSYGPYGNVSTSTASSLTSSLKTLCSSSVTDQCTQSLVSAELAKFYTACRAELTSGNTDVIRTYDTVYSVLPFLNALCSQDDSGAYCVTKIPATLAKSTSSASASNGLNVALASDSSLSPELIQHYLHQEATLRRRDTAVYLNASTFDNTNLMFLFLRGDLTSDVLCTTCTRKVLTSYINFESNVPYAPGIAKSTILSGQSALYTGVQSTCGSSFLSGAVQAAGSLSGSSSSGASRGMVAEMITVALGVFAIAVVSIA